MKSILILNKNIDLRFLIVRRKNSKEMSDTEKYICPMCGGRIILHPRDLENLADVWSIRNGKVDGMKISLEKLNEGLI